MINDRKLEGWDPYLKNEPATQTLPLTTIKLDGSQVKVQPYILPHQSKIAKTTFEKAAGPFGWIAHQGFYI